MKSYTITVNGNVYEVTVEENMNAAPAAPKAVPKAPVKAAPKAAPKAAGAQGSVKVVAPMPGKILTVKTSEGAVVKRGQVLFILEAMKMENEIFAPKNGTITSVMASKGAAVDTGTVLCTLA